jgi:ParB/RepB/Spo0J family partition protein
MTQQIEQIQKFSRKLIDPSPTNPRKSFLNLQELADSIKGQGVLQPLIARSKPKGRLELICGERRWRAADLAGLDELPVILRDDLTGQQILEIQIIENDQRDDVTELERAAGYQRLMKAPHNYTIEMLEQKLNRKRSYIYGALKLLSLPASIQKHVTEGRIVPSVALLLARIPDPKAQAECAKWVLEGRVQWVDQQQIKVPRSEREVSAYISENYMVRLKGASFELDDATLVPDSGTCIACPFRTGNMLKDVSEEEAARLKKSPDVCTRPACYKAKCDAQWAKVKVESKEAGLKTLTDAECQKLFQYGDRLSGDKYVDLNLESYDFNGRNRKWLDLVKDQPLDRYIARDPEGMLHEIALKKDALEAAKKNGHKPYTSSFERSGPSESALRKKVARCHKARDLAFQQICDKIEKKFNAGDYLDFLHLIISQVLHQHPNTTETIRLVARRRQLAGKDRSDAVKNLRQLAAELPIPKLRGLCLEIMLASNAHSTYTSKTWSEPFLAACKTFGVNLDKILKQLEADDKAKAKKKTKTAAAKAKSTRKDEDE